MSGYFKLLPIGRVVYYKGRTLYVKAVYDTGGVFISEGGEPVVITGLDKLEEVKL